MLSCQCSTVFSTIYYFDSQDIKKIEGGIFMQATLPRKGHVLFAGLETSIQETNMN